MTAILDCMIPLVRRWLLLIVLFGGGIALHPSFSLAVFDFPSFRIGIYQIALLGLVISSLPLVWERRHQLLRCRWLIIGGAFMGLSLGTGLITSLVPQRTALYSASLIALLGVSISAGAAFAALTATDRQWLLRAGLWSGVIVGLLSIIQLIIASIHPTAFGTLCTGCHPGVFGFPRINFLAAEPQFFASSLLPALLVAWWRLPTGGRLATFSLLLTSTALMLTFSRGAFMALAVALLLGSGLFLRRQANWRLIGKGSAVLAGGLLLGCSLLITSASVRYAQTPHIVYNTTVSMLEQLSLGVITIPQRTTPPEPSPASESPANAIDAHHAATDHFTPAGLVEASTADRLSAAQLAIAAWQESPHSVLFGTGLGNLGASLRRIGHDVPLDQTVYIFYVLLLTSMGVVGSLPLIAALCTVVWLWWRQPFSTWRLFALSLSLAIISQFWFFGSLINAAHCFAWIGVFLYNHSQNYE